MNDKTCTWYQPDGEELDYWEADCYNRRGFTFDDGPEVSGFNFCPYCGKPIELLPYEEEDEDEF